MQLESVYQGKAGAPVRIAVSLTKDETLGLLTLLTRGTELSYVSAQSAARGEGTVDLTRLRADLASMAKRRGWLDEGADVRRPAQR